MVHEDKIFGLGYRFEIFSKGKNMFYGNDSDGNSYKTRAHLAEVIAILRSTPPDFVQKKLTEQRVL
jgi:hypothetical protein